MRIEPNSLSALLALSLAACVNTPLANDARGIDQNPLILDIETICTQVPVRYVYFPSRAAHWDEACEQALSRARELQGPQGSLAILEALVDDLHDPHISLNANNDMSPRLVPSGSDLWVEKRPSSYLVTAVRPNSGAANAGIEPGDEVLEFNGQPLELAARRRIHASLPAVSEGRLLWAVNAALAGYRHEPRKLKVRRAGKIFEVSLSDAEPTSTLGLLEFERLEQNLGYIRFNNSLDDSNTIDEFDDALEELRATDGLILDLRNTPGGGNTGVAEPIIGRFLSKRAPYQVTAPPNEDPTPRFVEASGDWQYSAPVVVLVGKWTGSMGEGMAIGFDGLQRGQVLGTNMAGLAGGTEPILLHGLGLQLWIPTYDLQHVDGTPRHLWTPPEIARADNGLGDDVALELARAMLATEQ